jgi:hypothetical protein
VPDSSTTEATGPGGVRVRIVENDDRGQPYPLIQSQPANILGMSVYQEVVRLEMVRARMGQIFVSASIATTAAFTGQYVAIGYNVVGYLGSAGSVLLRSGLSNTFNLAAYTWEEPESYSSLAIEARQIVDGLPSGVTTGITVLSLAIAGTYWR